MYRVGQLSLSESAQEPDIGVTGAAGGEDSMQSCAVGGSLCHSDAVCVDYTPGFCCKCGDDYLGNGINCIPIGEILNVDIAS